VEFARDVLHHPLDPWQEWLAIHAGELLPDGRPRFRIVLVLVARQNGKTELLVVLSLYWQFVVAVPIVLGTSTKLDYAKESWTKATKLAERTPDLDVLRPARWKRETNGEQESWTSEESRYKIAASNEEGGRSLTINRLVLDELRQHHDYSAWDAAEPAASPWDAQIWALSNAGDDRSIVLNDLRESALEFIETGQGDYRLGLFEWSAPEGADPLDIEALAQANPNLGRRKDPDVLLANAARAVAKGGQALTGFKTEQMCIRVKLVDPAIDPGAWRDCLDVGDLAAARSRLAACVDLSPDGMHATLAAAAVLEDGRVRVETVHAWEGPGAAAALERELPGWVERLKPQTVGWFPAGPAAAVAAKLADRRKDGVRGWPPRGVTVAEIRGETSAVCMGLGKEIAARTLAHSGQALLNAQVDGAEKLPRGDAWVFTRRGGGNVDAVYAVAGAAHLARTLPSRRAVSRKIHVVPDV
jgi:phage terminase large subunit-like protein